jgi:hypothetical protein
VLARTGGSTEECGDSGGVPDRCVASLNDDVAKRALRRTRAQHQGAVLRLG